MYGQSMFGVKIRKTSTFFNLNCHFFAAVKIAVYCIGVLS